MITLVLGGTRSGKSAVAERIAATRPGPVTYLATLRADADPETAARVAAHRGRRPAEWRTVEVGTDLVGTDLVGTLTSTVGCVVLDGLGPWLATRPGFTVDAGAVAAALTGRPGDSVVVSDEVGLGVHPATAAGREFRDALGLLNQAVAAVADEVLLVVAGRVLRLEPAD